MHKVGAQLLCRWVVRLAARRERQRLDDGKENPSCPCRGAGHGRRDERLADGKPVGQTQRAAPQPFHEVGGDAVAEAGLDESAREEEGDDDEPDDLVGEGPERGGEGERARGDGGGEAEERPRADGQRAEDEPRDGGEEDGEELPRLWGHLGGARHEEADGEAGGERDEEGQRLRAARRRRGLRVRARFRDRRG